MAQKEAIEGLSCPTKIPHWRLVWDQSLVTADVRDYPYPGSGTEDDPYCVSWIPNDPRDPMNFTNSKKWLITGLVASSTLGVALVSSAFTGGSSAIMAEYDVSHEVVTLGVSLFVLGFAIGPLLWAPLSEVFGRQKFFITTYGAMSFFNAAVTGSQNIQTILVLRFFAGAFGASPLTNAGGVIADMFAPSQRGLAMALFASAPFLGPVIGPLVGGFLGMTAGWRWVLGFLATFSGVLWIVGSTLIPETYAPVLLRRRAKVLSKITGMAYRSNLDIDRAPVQLRAAFATALSRPWKLLFREPIVFLLSMYMAIIYGTLYMLFGAFPIVYEQHRGWNQGIGGLSFLGVLVGMLFALVYTVPDNKRYIKAILKNDGRAIPEARLPPSILGGIAIPVGLFWFAWTNSPSLPFMASIAGGVPFGFGMVLVFLSVLNYLIDAYTIYAASVLAASAVVRSLFGAAFPLFTTQMFQNLGIHWASCIPAFLSLACVPFPFICYQYGKEIRRRCKYAAEADDFMRKLSEKSKEEVPEINGQIDDSNPEAHVARPESPPPILSRRSLHLVPTVEYEGNPFDIDRVNTRD
ncbi:MFS multidrug transporter [Aspergillus piperis CBS 112811]|uniref:MFS multidrug transporter n=1 Tax=Aspergillus piperis CBS 112811 TaxID=1448313 RepID=A0A8G1VL13_9EURO|nr:MFS multidrug transporter [Aspergillus piperis CBS 112811]RAH57334.1 MFS multidrug transporter [Aspergillus piperis CBS 112811]